jgi:hypothetical protein
MDRSMTEPSDSPDDLLIDRAATGNEAALAELFGRYRKRLRAMVRLRMDRRLQGRVDPSDVLQEAYLDVARQLPSHQAKPEMPFYLWLRLTTGQRLMRLHRQHLGAAMRDAGREVSLHRGALPQASEDFKPGSGDATGTFGGAEIPAWSSGSNAWATTGCSAKLVAVAWGWFTRPSRNRWAVAWR